MGYRSIWTAAAAALCFSGVAFAGPVHLACKHVAGGTWWNPAYVTIDSAAQEVTSGEGARAYATPAEIEITDRAIKWSWMRGFVGFDRKCGKLDWDMTAEYDYLTAIDQPPDEPREDYRGSMQCTESGEGK